MLYVWRAICLIMLYKTPWPYPFPSPDQSHPPCGTFSKPTLPHKNRSRGTHGQGRFAGIFVLLTAFPCPRVRLTASKTCANLSACVIRSSDQRQSLHPRTNRHGSSALNWFHNDHYKNMSSQAAFLTLPDARSEPALLRIPSSWRYLGTSMLKMHDLRTTK